MGVFTVYALAAKVLPTTQHTHTHVYMFMTLFSFSSVCDGGKVYTQPYIYSIYTYVYYINMRAVMVVVFVIAYIYICSMVR